MRPCLLVVTYAATFATVQGPQIATSPGPPPTDSALLGYTSSADIDGVMLALESGANIEVVSADGLTPLMMAAEGWQDRHAVIVTRLVQAGASLERQDTNGVTALMRAAQKGRLGACTALLEARADVAHTDSNGWSALLHAAAKGRKHAVELLLAHGAAVGHSARDGECAITLAAKGGHLETVRELLAHGADVNQQTAVGKSALMLAAARGDAALTRFLLVKAHASLDLRDAEGHTAEQVAEAHGFIHRGLLWDTGTLTPIFAAARTTRSYRAAADGEF